MLHLMLLNEHFCHVIKLRKLYYLFSSGLSLINLNSSSYSLSTLQNINPYANQHVLCFCTFS